MTRRPQAPLALVRLFVGTDLYQGFTILVASYVLHFGGQAFGPARRGGDGGGRSTCG